LIVAVLNRNYNNKLLNKFWAVSLSGRAGSVIRLQDRKKNLTFHDVKRTPAAGPGHPGADDFFTFELEIFLPYPGMETFKV
jgi:hypothetical protein